jgi:transcriptional regulator with XRE-family HTH domain
MTLSDVGGSLGVSGAHISKVERGLSPVGIGLLERMVGLYGYELELTIVQRRGGSELRHRLL